MKKSKKVNIMTTYLFNGIRKKFTSKTDLNSLSLKHINEIFLTLIHLNDFKDKAFALLYQHPDL